MSILNKAKQGEYTVCRNMGIFVYDNFPNTSRTKQLKHIYIDQQESLLLR